ncbi:MAG: TlpA disulfide reductase family protein [Bacteroidales bacterium]|jgi:thiol-disulfide isomerase/thioredoxin|nr:TlpA disulfide reductase family protein [Bacteroidales bacterium]
MSIHNRLLIVLLILFSSCSSKNEDIGIQVGTVIINGKVEMDENSSKVISLSYACSNDRCDSGTEIIDSNGNFRFEIKVLHAQDVLLKYEKGFARLFIQPNDSLVLTLNSEKFRKDKHPDFKISGTNSVVSKDILNYLRFRNIKDFQPELENKSVNEYLNDLRKQINIEDSILSVFKKDYNPSELFMLWAKKNIIYGYANYLLDYKWYQEDNNLSFEGDLFDKDLFSVNDDKAIITSWYNYHLINYSRKYFQKDTLNIYRINEDFLNEYRSVLNNIINNEKAGISRELICYWLYIELLDKSSKDFLELFKEVTRFIENKELISLLTERKEQCEFENNKHISSFYSDTREENKIIGEVFKNLAEKHKNKIIYLDIWATWCSHCKKELPYSIELYNNYKNKPVVFVNLCLSSDKEEWKKLLDNNSLIGENYYFNKAESEILTSTLKFSGYPTYIIIDKTGYIIDNNAPRPSSKLIREKLDKIILD